jgi:hypothetical protein
MQTAQGNMLLSLQNVQAFLEKNADRLDGVANTGARQRLDDAVVKLSTYVLDQTESGLAARGATQKQKSLRVVLLRDHMAPIARIARADLPRTPELTALLMPRGHPTSARLAAAASGMAKAAAPHAGVFISNGLPADFIERLNGAVRAMLASLTERSQSRGRRKGATTGLKADLVSARKIVHVLDAFVKSATKDDPALLANWNLLKRIPKTPGHGAATPQPAGAVAAAPATPSAPVTAVA